MQLSLKTMLVSVTWISVMMMGIRSAPTPQILQHLVIAAIIALLVPVIEISTLSRLLRRLIEAAKKRDFRIVNRMLVQILIFMIAGGVCTLFVISVLNELISIGNSSSGFPILFSGLFPCLFPILFSFSIGIFIGSKLTVKHQHSKEDLC